jgi:DNA mismatch repair protein MutL
MDTLGHSGVPQLQLRPEHMAQAPFAPALPGVLAGGTYPNRWRPIPTAVSGQVPPQSTLQDVASAVGYPHTPEAQPPSTLEAQPPSTLHAQPLSTLQAQPTSTSRDATEIKPMIPLGQFRDTFIIAVDDDGVAIIDQHVAHERVLFERVMERLTQGRLESQRLLVPMLLEVAPSAHQALVSRAAELDRLGFEIEGFGSATIKVTAVPALLKNEDSSKALLALAEDLEGLDRGAHVQDALQRIAATTACHAAVKANYPLTYEKMAHILDELRATAYSTVCPHGRPVMLRLTRREIEKNFDRI